ncbi:MAG TPA: tetratricopeptide repeat protein [Thermoanaerobaculia bacterium]
MNEPTDWASAVAILAAGLFLGALIVYFFSRRKATAVVATDLERKDLEAKRDALVAQLRALDDDNVEERARLEAETADVLRRLDRQPQPAGASAGQSPAPAAAPAINPAVKGFLWGAGSFAALAGLAYFVMNQATPRQEGGSLTGNTPVMQQPQAAPQQVSPVVTQLEAAVQKQPNNLQLRNDLAQAYLETDNLMAVFEQTKFVLDQSPNDARALTLQSLVRMAMGEADQAMQMLERATKSDPKNLDAWVARAWVYVQQNRMDDAAQMIAEAKKASPNDAARIDQVFTQMKMQASAQPAEQMAGGELPPGHPPVDGAPGAAPAPAAPAASNDGRSITVTLDLDPSAARKSGVVFVIARNPMGGPPAAVKRMQVMSFPVTLQLGSADSMMGQPLPDKFRLEARLDSDGDAATKPPTDPSAMQNDVVPGASVKLALK